MTRTRPRPADRPEGARTFRHRRVPATRGQLVAVAAVAAIGGVLAVVAADAAPTGGAVTDAVLRAVLPVSAAVAGSRARRAYLAWAPLVLAPCAPLPWAVGLAVAGAAGLAVWRFGRRDRVIGAVIGGASGLGALFLTRPAVLGATAALAAAALVPLVVSGYLTSRRSARRRVNLGLLCLLGLVVAATAASVLFGVREADRLRAAADQSVEAAGTIGEGPAVDRRPFDRADASFSRTVDNADSWWMLPARNLPVVGPNVRAVRDAAASAAEVNRTAAELASQIDFDRVRRPDGGIDVQAVELLRGPVGSATAALERALDRVDATNSPWLALPLRDRLTEFRDLLDQVAADAQLAELAVRSVPGLLGVDGPRRYLLLLGSPAELRDLGGHIGNWAEITAVDGRLDVARVGEPYELYGPGDGPRPTVLDPDAYPPALMGLAPEVFPQNWAGSPDLPTVAQLVSELYPQVPGGGLVDGVLYADPWAFAALLELTGPQQLPGTGTTLTAENAVSYLTRDQYRVDGEGSDAALSDAIEASLERLVTGLLPSPRRLGATFGPVVRGGHLAFTSLVPDDGAFLRRLGVERGVVPTDGEDLLAVLNRNANPNKADAYLRRTVDDRITWDPGSGRVTSEVTVSLTNGVPPGLPPLVSAGPPGTPEGTNRTELSVLTPFRLDALTVDGEAVPATTSRERPGLFRHAVVVDLAPGLTRTVRLELAGRVRPGDEYRLRWVGQPTVAPERHTVSVRAPAAGMPSDRALRIPADRRDADLRLRLGGGG